MDVKCLVCGEPWDYWGLYHGDVQAWEADAIKKGLGCPHCEGNPPEEGYEPENLSDFEYGDEDPTDRIISSTKPKKEKYQEPEDQVLQTCIGCGVQRVRKLSEEVYDGSQNRSKVFDWKNSCGTISQTWDQEWKLREEDPETTMEDFHGKGPACPGCVRECADCDAVIAVHDLGDFSDLDDYEGRSYMPEGLYNEWSLRCYDCFIAFEAERELENQAQEEYDAE